MERLMVVDDSLSDEISSSFDQSSERHQLQCPLPIVGPHSAVPSNGRTLHASSSLIFGSRRRSTREKWDRKAEFLLSIIGFSVDLGNVWRFPSVVYQSGGGAFFIPYFIMLILVGFPLFYLELVLGQYHRTGVFTVWRYICPLAKGIGPATLLINFMMAMYYNTIISWAVYYFFASFRNEVPWKRCGHEWNTECCLDADIALYKKTTSNSTFSMMNSLTNASFSNCSKYTLSTTEFFQKQVQAIGPENNFSNLGDLKWELCLCLIFVFILTYFALWKGVKSSGKFVWVTAIAPYFALVILLIRGITLDGAMLGIKFYLKPDLKLLKSFRIWNEAATQICFSLGPGFGTLLALSSYNHMDNDCFRDAVLTSIINCLTSILSGFVVFSTLGHMAKISGTSVIDVIQDKGSEIVFIVYPHVVALMKGSTVWALMFFFMLVTLGLDSTFAGLESIITGLCDEYPVIFRKYRKMLVAIVLLICFIGALPTCTNGGPYVVDLMNELSVSPAILFVLLVECLAVAWAYGTNSMADDIQKMMGNRPGFLLKFTWAVISPIVLTSMLVTQIQALITDSVMIRGLRISELPIHTQIISYLIIIIPISTIPIYVVYKILRTKGGSIDERLARALRPVTHEVTAIDGTTEVELQVKTPVPRMADRNKGTIRAFSF